MKVLTMLPPRWEKPFQPRINRVISFRKKVPKGQSAVEFVLIAPLLFLIFFGIIQLSYMAYVSLAVQRAALAVARNASLSGRDNSLAFKTQLVISLFPITNLSSKTLSTILASDYKITFSSDYQEITAQVRYPMPIWVPLVQNFLGEDLASPGDTDQTSEGEAIIAVYRFLGKTPPDLSFQGLHQPVVWLNYQVTTFNEGY